MKASILAALALVVSSHVYAVCYVDAKAIGGANDGSSWGNAYTDLQSALTNPSCSEIWVAKGVYKPTSGSNPTVSFVVNSGVVLYGGFAGTESSLAQRVLTGATTSVLSGDIDNNDNNVGGDQIDVTFDDIVGTNSIHILFLDGEVVPITSSTVIDGFTITGGAALNTMAGGQDASGGGLYCLAENVGGECSPTLQNLVFSGNVAAISGGAIMDDADGGGTSSPTLTNVTFFGNQSFNQGGAIMNNATAGGHASPQLSDVTFSHNGAEYSGGGMYNIGFGGSCNPSLKNVSFYANRVSLAGAGGGAIFNDGNGHMLPSLVNVTFFANVAKNGGAIYNNGASPALTQVTFSGNNALNDGGAIYNEDTGTDASAPILHNTILWGDTASASGAEIFNDADATTTLDYSVLQGICPMGTGCTHVTALDPALQPYADHGGRTRVLMLGQGSVAIDGADDTQCPATDQRGLKRPQGPHCDIGAVERQPVEDIIFRDGFERF